MSEFILEDLSHTAVIMQYLKTLQLLIYHHVLITRTVDHPNIKVTKCNFLKKKFLEELNCLLRYFTFTANTPRNAAQ